MWSIVIHEATGRLLKYDPRTKQVTVLLRALAFGNGVALSKDNSYVLITETTRSRILRYWLRGPKSDTSDVFLDVPQYPDNIKRTPKGEFWVAINSGKGTIERLNMTRVEEGVEEAKRGRAIGETVAMRIDGEGRVVEVLGEGGEFPTDSNNASSWGDDQESKFTVKDDSLECIRRMKE
ncbi:Strictosidine synthase 1 [Acorus gramineus]|uniref:Strictosidine synthase 1 n=1 Tax=Acorus gramineus TaxID=55184 RepID=A0AAV9AVY4_ACOGR|nr:Strictosidine synthase 1 [Acorus gramineus]